MNFETVKTVNGYEITRYKEGARGYYYVNVEEGERDVIFEIHTLKAAIDFCKSIPARA